MVADDPGDSQDVVDRFFDLLIGDGKSDGAMPLRIHVHEQGPLTHVCEARRQVNGARGLAAAAFLIDESDDTHGLCILASWHYFRAISRASCSAPIRGHFDIAAMEQPHGKWRNRKALQMYAKVIGEPSAFA